MSFTATVKNGVINLPAGLDLPDGMEVTIEPKEAAGTVENSRQSFAERYAEFVGCVHSGVGDLADNHDHYLYGAARRES